MVWRLGRLGRHLAGSTYSAGNFTLAGNSIVGATVNNWGTTVTNVIAKYTEDKNLLATGINARYRADDMTVKFDASYSQARRNNTWAAQEWNVWPQSVTFNTAAGVAPSISTATNVTDPSAQSYAGTGLTGPQSAGGRAGCDVGRFQLQAAWRGHHRAECRPALFQPHQELQLADRWSADADRHAELRPSTSMAAVSASPTSFMPI
jgi:hypothetical protein